MPCISVNQTTSYQKEWEGNFIEKKLNLRTQGYENFEGDISYYYIQKAIQMFLCPQATKFHLNHFVLIKGCPLIRYI